MAVYKTESYARGKLQKKLTPQNGDIFIDCNFTQVVPHTKILEGIANLRFERCNLVNCDVPLDAEIIDCNTTQKSMCSHLHPNWELEKCPDDCEHKSDEDEVIIDGQSLGKQRHYEDKVVI